MTVSEILLDHLEMQLNGDDTTDDKRSGILDAVAVIEGSGVPEFERGEWDVIGIADFVELFTGFELDTDDVELFGKLLKSFN